MEKTFYCSILFVKTTVVIGEICCTAMRNEFKMIVSSRSFIFIATELRKKYQKKFGKFRSKFIIESLMALSAEFIACRFGQIHIPISLKCLSPLRLSRRSIFFLRVNFIYTDITVPAKGIEIYTSRKSVKILQCNSMYLRFFFVIVVKAIL